MLQEVTTHMRRLLTAGTVALILLALFLLVRSVNALKENKFIGGGVPASNTIYVNGHGEVNATPDTGQFSFTLHEENKDATEAKRIVTEKGDAIFAFLKSKGVEEKDIKTNTFTVYPHYEYRSTVGVAEPALAMPMYYDRGSTQVFVGMVVEQTVTVKVRNVDDAGTLIAGVTDQKVQNVSGLTFTVDDPDMLQREARKEAIDQAHDKAEELAKDLGVTIVRVVSFSESGGGYPMPYYAKAEMATAMDGQGSSVPTLPTGETTVSSDVTITYEIE